MEIEVSLERWKAMVLQLREIEAKLGGLHREIQEAGGLHREVQEAGGLREVMATIRKEEELLHRQMISVADMRIALEKAGRIYADGEESVIDAGETQRKQFAEHFGTVDLSGYQFVNAILK